MRLDRYRSFFSLALAAVLAFATFIITPAVSFAHEAFPDPVASAEQIAALRDYDGAGSPGLTRPQVVSFQLRQVERASTLNASAPLSGITTGAGLVLIA